jgi:amino acid adenylation domain-containing protein
MPIMAGLANQNEACSTRRFLLLEGLMALDVAYSHSDHPLEVVLLTTFATVILREFGEDYFNNMGFSVRINTLERVKGPLRLPLVNAMTFGQALGAVAKALPGSFNTSPKWETLSIRCWTLGGISLDNQSRAIELKIHNDDRLTARIAIPPALSDFRKIEWTEDHFRTLLDALGVSSASPPKNCLDVALENLPLFGPESELVLLQNNFAVPEPEPDLLREETLVDLFLATAAKYPDRKAVECGGHSLTYFELNAESSRVAAILAARGVKRGDLVALHMYRSIEAIIAILGVLKSGAAYVPIDPDYPSDRLKFIVEDCGARWAIAHGELAEKFASCSVFVWEVLCKGTVGSLPPAECKTSSRDLAYIIYTSGSSGTPKGVMIEHRSVAHFVRAEGHIFQLNPSDRVFQGFSHAFDASVEEIWLAFFAGATLVVATPDVAFAAADLGSFINEKKITVFSTVPTILSLLKGPLASLRLLILGGESLPRELADEWSREGLRIVNTYGPTEATVVATYQDCIEGKKIYIGKALPNVATYVVDQNLNFVPAGAPGELVIGGPALARGYVNGHKGESASSKAKFVCNPFAEYRPAEDRLYRTGDMVRMNVHGRIEFLGRIDGQVKIRGFRVELNEIETQLKNSPGVRSATVITHRDETEMDRLIAFVVPLGGQPFHEGAVYGFLKAKLAPFMLPDAIYTLNEIPLLVSGKVDRRRLQSPAREVAAASEMNDDQIGIERDDPIENLLVGQWQRILPRRPTSTDDDFFNLGGHSLLAARLVSNLRSDRRFRSLSIGDIYHHSTIRRLAARLREISGGVSSEGPIPETPHEQKDPQPQARHLLCGLAQALALYPIFALLIFPWVGLVSAAEEIDQWLHWGPWLLTSLLSPLLLFFFPLLAIAAKWLLIGRYRAGTYPLWGFFYFRFWLVRKVEAMAHLFFFHGSPVLNWYYRAMGAKIGRFVFVGSSQIHVPDLLTLDDYSSVGFDADLLGFSVKNGQLTIGAISVGKNSSVGTKALMSPNTSLGDDASLSGLSLLSEGNHIPDSETWAGSPASPHFGRRRRIKAKPSKHPWRSALMNLGHALGLAFISYLMAADAGLSWQAFALFRDHFGAGPALLSAPLFSALFVISFSLQIALLKWLLMGRRRPEQFQIQSFYYLRRWFVSTLLQIHLEICHTLYATLYLNWFLRLLWVSGWKSPRLPTCPPTFSPLAMNALWRTPPHSGHRHSTAARALRTRRSSANAFSSVIPPWCPRGRRSATTVWWERCPCRPYRLWNAKRPAHPGSAHRPSA